MMNKVHHHHHHRWSFISVKSNNFFFFFDHNRINIFHFHFPHLGSSSFFCRCLIKLAGIQNTKVSHPLPPQLWYFFPSSSKRNKKKSRAQKKTRWSINQSINTYPRKLWSFFFTIFFFCFLIINTRKKILFNLCPFLFSLFLCMCMCV